MKLEIITDSNWQNPVINFFASPGEVPTQTLTPFTDDYNDKIKNQGTFLTNSILPPAIRYVDYAKGIIAFERPPSYVKFNFSPYVQQKLKIDGDSKKTINLPIPWQLYVAKLGRNGLPSVLFVFFSNSQLTSLDSQPMNRAPLPNLYSNGSVCLPVYNHHDEVEYDLIDAVSNIYDIVWNSGFNLDVFQCANDWCGYMKYANPLAKVQYHDNQIKWYQNWGRYTLNDALALSWECPVHTSFNDLLTHIYSLEEQVDHYDSLVDFYLAAK